MVGFIRFRRQILLILGLCLGFLMATPYLGVGRCLAEERILSFDSQIQIHKDATVGIQEVITVRAEGAQIKRGIFRWLPTRYKDKLGNAVNVEYEIVSVMRDGNPEPYQVDTDSDHIIVYFGSKSVSLQPGEYTYTFSYKTSRQIGYFDGYDELYWNVTGNDWTFVINKATCVVRLPEGAPMLQMHGYTGNVGESGQYYDSGVNQKGQVWFATTQPLRPRQGLTVAVAWPKGVVHEPDAGEKARYLLSDNLHLVVAVCGMLIVFIYFFIAWMYVGRDPQRWTIVPLFAPPKGFSPAAVRFVVKMGFDNKAFAATIISLAAKGIISISEEKKVFTLTRLSRAKKNLSSGERKVAEELFSRNDSIELKQKNHFEIGRAQKGLKKALALEHETAMFKTNAVYLIPGIVLSLLTLVAIALSLRGEAKEMALFMTLWLSGWTVGCIFLLRGVVAAWRGPSKLKALGPTMFALPFMIGEVVGLVLYTIATSPLTMLCLLALMVLLVLFHHLLKAPTFAGRRVMDEIEGFKLFLSVSEKERLEMLNPPERTPELFERFLPYALALDVENSWSEQFSDVLSKAGVDGQPYHPMWYHGRSWDRYGASGFAGAIGSGFSSALGSSSTAPGSSSGSGGGGFSGGGGGGGGGGGW